MAKVTVREIKFSLGLKKSVGVISLVTIPNQMAGPESTFSPIGAGAK